MTFVAPSTPDLVVELDDGVLVVSIDRAEFANTITYSVLEQLLAVLEAIDGADEVRVVVLTGSGEHFSFGTDLQGDDGLAAGAERAEGAVERDIGGEVAIKIFGSSRPVIAAIRGHAVGIGVSMILPADVRICGSTARFTFPFVRRGIVPESCSTWFLPRIVGISTATYWALTGLTVSAEEAERASLVHEVVAPEDVLARAVELARDIAHHCAPVSVALARQMMWRGLGDPHPMRANELESAVLESLRSAPDAAEGVRAFFEKRPPVFATPASRAPVPQGWWVEPAYGDSDSLG